MIPSTKLFKVSTFQLFSKFLEEHFRIYGAVNTNGRKKKDKARHKKTHF